VENEDGVFLIMEYVDGITLDDFINTKQGLIVEAKAYELFSQILDAFAYAHKQGVIHRDIKPANIILTNDNEGNFVVKILDFGIARIVSESNEDEKGLVVGTPAYMSPEQVRGENTDERSDIYSLGVLLHQMLTGHAPYDSTTLSETEIQKKVVEDPLPRMKEYYQYISDRMQKVVNKATAKDPTARYPNCIAFRKDFLPKPQIPLWQKIKAAAVLILLIVGGYWYYSYNYIPKVYYYKDYVEQWGVPVGIGNLSKSDSEHRTESYRFEKLKGKIVRISHINSKGNITEHHDSEHMERYNDALLYYTHDGKIDYIKVRNKNGRVLYKKDYDENLKTVIFKHNDEFGTEMSLAASTT
jgi:serine/threonine-protein kinase